MSLIRQQKIWAFGAGVGAAVIAYYSTRGLIWSSSYNLGRVLAHDKESPDLPEPEPLIGRQTRAWAVKHWNEMVDSVMKPAIEALSKRNL
eukprot:jgi/Botrbrau1/19946/Bobra.0059s0063.1